MILSGGTKWRPTSIVALAIEHPVHRQSLLPMALLTVGYQNFVCICLADNAQARDHFEESNWFLKVWSSVTRCGPLLMILRRVLFRALEAVVSGRGGQS